MRRLVISITLLTSGLTLLISTPSLAGVDEVVGISLDGVVDPLAARYVERNIRAARDRGAAGVLVRIDTPGGLDSSMRTIIRSIHQAGIPVICWVGPSGARAASAGAIVMLGCPFSSMAPGTNIGAAHPVGLTGEVLAEKITNDAAAYARSLAQERGRDPEIAERMVRESLSLSAGDAQTRGIIDAIASDEAAALDAAALGGPGATLTITRAHMSFVEGLLHDAVDPNLAFILLIVGLLGLVSEVLHPGITVGGIFGGLSLLAALLILGMLPVNLAGVLLILAGLGLMVAEVYLPGGIAGAAGLTALVLGGLFLFDASIPGAQVSKGLLIAIALATMAFFLTVVRALMRARTHPPESATMQNLIGIDGVVERTLDPAGIVRARNESWSARAAGDPIVSGARVRVTGVDGLTLEVERIEDTDRSSIET